MFLLVVRTIGTIVTVFGGIGFLLGLAAMDPTIALPSAVTVFGGFLLSSLGEIGSAILESRRLLMRNLWVPGPPATSQESACPYCKAPVRVRLEEKGMEHECWRCRRPFIAISGQPEK